jgi:uncharacterized protein with predicted RNA binding PUA domain
VFIVVELVCRSRGSELEDVFRRIRSVADYQFGEGVGGELFPENVEVTFSRKTRRIRYIHLKGQRLATMRPTDGLFSLSIVGAKRIVESLPFVECSVIVRDDIARFIADGGDVFAAHVLEVSDRVRSKDEVIVVDGFRKVLAVGRAVLSGTEMKTFKKGVAIKVRHGCASER